MFPHKVSFRPIFLFSFLLLGKIGTRKLITPDYFFIREKQTYWQMN